MTTYAWYIIIGAAIAFIVSKIRIIPEDQRRAIVAMGRFRGFKGPGVAMKWSGRDTIWSPVSIGQLGELLDSNLGRFEDVTIPIKVEDEAMFGDVIRIRAFEDDKACVVRNPDQKQTFLCEKCGHENRIVPRP